MKTIILILALCSCLTSGAQYYNTNGTFSSVLPTFIVNSDGSVTSHVSTNQLITVGWRWVQSTQSPSNGWAVSSYSVSNEINGWAVDLVISNQFNIQAASDASITNQPLWTSTFVTNAQRFRANLRASGTTETNAVVTPDTIDWYISQLLATNTTAVVTNLSQYIFMANEAAQLLIIGHSQTTATFPWRLIP